METKTLYYYHNGKIHETKGNITIVVKSGFDISSENVNEKELLLEKIRNICIRSKIYSPSLVHLCNQNLQTILKNTNEPILFFERKDICEVLKENAFCKKMADPNTFVLTVYNLINKTIKFENEIVRNMPEMCRQIQQISKIYTKKFYNGPEEPDVETLVKITKLESVKQLIFYILDDIYNENENTYDSLYYLMSIILVDIEDENNKKQSILYYIQQLKEIQDIFTHATQVVLFKDSTCNNGEPYRISKKDNSEEIDIDLCIEFITKEIDAILLDN